MKKDYVFNFQLTTPHSIVNTIGKTYVYIQLTNQQAYNFDNDN